MPDGGSLLAHCFQQKAVERIPREGPRLRGRVLNIPRVLHTLRVRLIRTRLLCRMDTKHTPGICLQVPGVLFGRDAPGTHFLHRKNRYFQFLLKHFMLYMYISAPEMEP